MPPRKMRSEKCPRDKQSPENCPLEVCPPGKIPPEICPRKTAPEENCLPVNCTPKIILWILCVFNFIFIEIFHRKLKLISLNILIFNNNLFINFFLRLFISLSEYFWFSAKYRNIDTWPTMPGNWTK